MGKTLFDKIWDAHTVKNIEGDIYVLYIDIHYIHEVTSPQAFNELKERNLTIFRPKKIIATTDHNVPTTNQNLQIKDPLAKKQVNTLSKNCRKHGIQFYGIGNRYQGIVHVIGPELGITLPGMTVVCGDSHTSTHGAFGSISFGIGTSQIAMVMASQCILQNKPKQMRFIAEGFLRKSGTQKDVILYIISKLGSFGGTGYFVEYSGPIFEEMSMEGRMTVCNMSIEMGAKGGLVSPDETTFKYIKRKKFSPKRVFLKKSISYWKTLLTDKWAIFDSEYIFDAKNIRPMITYGTNPSMGIKINEKIPKTNFSNKEQLEKSLRYMGLKIGESLIGKRIKHVFMGSCTNSRIEDLRLFAKVVNGRKKANHVQAMIVPGSKKVYFQAKKEGLNKILKESGFELRQAGCSACIGMNGDKIPSGEYCVSTSNRNFEGRQGTGSRTLLVSPLVAAIIAIEGKIVDIDEYLKNNNIFH